MGTIGLDITDKDYRLKERILGVQVVVGLLRDAISFELNISARRVSNLSTSTSSRE